MPTPTFLTGLEHGVAIAGAAVTPTNDRVWTSVVTTGGTPGINTSTPKHGVNCLDIPATAASESGVRRVIQGTPGIVVASFYIRFVSSLPTADCRLFCIVPAAGSFGFLQFVSSSGTLHAGFGTAAGAGFAVSPDTWYLVDYKVDYSVNPRTCDVSINGTAQTQATTGVATSTASSLRLGKNIDTTTANGNIRYDDIVISHTAGDYPMGEHECLKMSPNADGTHSFTNNDFIQGDAGSGFANTATNIWTFIDDTDLTTHSTTDSVQQNVIRTTGYIEINFESAPSSENAWGIQITGAFDADATGADTSGMRLWDGTTEDTLYAPANGDVSNLGPPNGFLSFCRATNPSGGAWDTTALNGIRMRWGFSGDVTGSPIMQAAMIEAAFPISQGAPEPPHFLYEHRPRQYVAVPFIQGGRR